MAGLALLPISLGAVVTTVEAGMAFADWPSSDGHNMLLYPWWQSSGDKFLEHGHRLAGMLIGVMSLCFCGWAMTKDGRPVIRILAWAVLVGVIAQGLLGGLRVTMNKNEMALLHGNFAAWVFTAMCLTVMASSPATESISDMERPRLSLLLMSAVTFLTVAVQYVLGGRLRHLQTSDAWLIHPWFAAVVVVAVLGLHVLASRQALPRIQTTSLAALWLVFAQAGIGLVTWAALYGYPQWDIQGDPLSPARVASSSLHKVTGLLTFAAVGVAFVQTLIASRQHASRQHTMTDSATHAPSALAVGGGAA